MMFYSRGRAPECLKYSKSASSRVRLDSLGRKSLVTLPAGESRRARRPPILWSAGDLLGHRHAAVAELLLDHFRRGVEDKIPRPGEGENFAAGSIK